MGKAEVEAGQVGDDCLHKPKQRITHTKGSPLEPPKRDPGAARWTPDRTPNGTTDSRRTPAAKERQEDQERKDNSL